MSEPRFDPNSPEISREEFEAQKRFYAEQYKSIGSQVAALVTAIQETKPETIMHPKVREVLTKQVDRLAKQVDGFNIRLLAIEKKLGINIQK